MLITKTDAQGIAASTLKRAEASAASLDLLSAALTRPGGQESARLDIADKWISAVGSAGGRSVVRVELGDGRSVVEEAMGLVQGNASGDSGKDGAGNGNGDGETNSCAVDGKGKDEQRQ